MTHRSTCVTRLVVALTAAVVMTGEAQSARKMLVAHRGASAYAPQHTLAAYQLALDQGADYVEQDLVATKDGVLICLHGLDGGPPDIPGLEVTTNVEEVFPDRAVTVNFRGRTVRTWPSTEFTLAEIKRLDAGSSFDKKFAGARIPTFQEAIDLVKGKAGLYPELKAPEFHEDRKLDLDKLVIDALTKNGLIGAKQDSKTPVILQTFSEETLRKLAVAKPGIPLVLLISEKNAAEWNSRDRIAASKKLWANGLGPSKAIVEKYPQFVQWAHAEGLTVTPYTFRSRNTGKFPSVRAEMEHFLYTLGVDGVFTDNPDQFPRK